MGNLRVGLREQIVPNRAPIPRSRRYLHHAAASTGILRGSFHAERTRCAIPKNTSAPKPARARKPTPPELVPRVIARPSLDDHLAVMSRAIFQAGMSWAFIESRWNAFLAAFDHFAIARVAAYGEADVERLMDAEGVIHARGKIEGTIANARTLLALERQYGSIAAYAGSFADYASLYTDAHARFAYLGDLSCYYWLFRTGLPVPPFERWMERQKSDHPRMREMVLTARGEGLSAEKA